MKKTVIVLVVLGLMSIPFSARALEFGVRGYYWFPELDGHVKVDAEGLFGTRLDFTEDLGIDDENYPMIEAFAGIGDHHISVSAMQIDYSGEKNVGEINFGGETFRGEVKSALKCDMIDIEYQHDLIDLENILAGFSIGIIGKIKYIDGEVELRSNMLSISEKETFTAYIPMIGVGAHVGLIADLLEARIKATGIGYSDTALYDIFADVSVTPFPFLDIHAGYRIIDFDVDDIDDVELKYSMSGPYAALTVGF